MKNEEKLALLRRKLELILLVTRPAETRSYRESSWAGVLRNLEAHPIASAIRQADVELERVMNDTLSEDEISFIHSELKNTFSGILTAPENQILHKIVACGSIANDGEALAARDFISGARNVEIKNDLMEKLGALLANYETKLTRGRQ